MDNLVIAGKSYASRLLVGTGKYKDFNETRAAVDASGAEIITVAIRRTNLGQGSGKKTCTPRRQPGGSDFCSTSTASC